LTWGRETAGLEVEEAAKKIQIKPERLESWEAGEKQPTINQLRKLAHVYRRPLSVFFLPERPPEAVPAVHDFRQLPGRPPGALSYHLRLQLRRARERRQIALDLYRELDEPAPEFGLRAALDDDPEELGGRIREVLGVDLETQQRWRQPYKALKAWRERTENAGVLVFQASGVPVSEMRGLSLAVDPLPVVMINPKDAPNARVFTMMHELCHVALRNSGVCEPESDRALPAEERGVEIFCNHVASAALVPMGDLLADETVDGQRNPSWADDDLDQIAKRFAVSRFVVLRRLLTAGRTSRAFYRAKHEEWTRQVQEQEATGGFVTPDSRAVAEGGQTFVRLVLQSYHQDRITLSDVSDYLGVRIKHLPKIEKAVGY